MLHEVEVELHRIHYIQRQLQRLAITAAYRNAVHLVDRAAVVSTMTQST